jgi:hypothetical protein
VDTETAISWEERAEGKSIGSRGKVGINLEGGWEYQSPLKASSAGTAAKSGYIDISFVELIDPVVMNSLGDTLDDKSGKRVAIIARFPTTAFQNGTLWSLR